VKKLHGKTVLRLSHYYEDVGGIEQYIKDMDRHLLENNEIHMIQLYFTYNAASQNRQETFEKGTLTLIPIVLDQEHPSEAVFKKPFPCRLLTDIKMSLYHLFLRLFFGPAFERLVLARCFRDCRKEPLFLKADVLKEKIDGIFGAEKNIDLLVIHGIRYPGNAMTAAVVAKKHKKPIVLQLHENNETLADSYVKKIASYVDLVLLNSSRNIPGGLNINQAPMYDAVDLRLFSLPRVSGSQELQKKINMIRSEARHALILLPARIAESKGHLDLLEIVRRAKERLTENFEIRLLFVGRTDDYYVPYRQAIIQKAKDLKIEINFAQEKKGIDGADPENMPLYYAAADIVALPSHTEGLGRVLLEAQAMERPVVAYDVGGVADAFDHNSDDTRTGYLIPHRDTEAFAEAIVTMLRNKELYKEISARCRRHVEKHFSYEAFMLRCLNYYDKVINKASGSS